MSNESSNQSTREPAAALAVKLARESAFAHCNEHRYLPQTREQANSWQPHEWVVAAVHTAALIASLPAGHRFQADVADWMDQCFLPSLYSNMTERGDRLLEEVLELLQAHDYDSARVPTLVNYVFGRPVGEPAQEVGGVMVTLAAYCSVAGLSLQADGQAELDRINQPEVMARIRAKQEAKNALHFDTPLPGDAAQSSPAGQGDALATLQQEYDKLLAAFDRQVEAAERIAATALEQDDRIEELEEALAARRPFGATGKDSLTVGGGQAVVSAHRFIQRHQGLEHTIWMDGDASESEVEAERTGVGRIERAYAAPPAQAVDLGPVRVLADQAAGRINHAYNGLCPDEVEGHDARDPDCLVCRALIDSKAVGNG